MLNALPIESEVESKAVLRKLVYAHKALAELKGVISSIPNENVLIETLTLREAKESSAIEGFLEKNKVGRDNFYLNKELFALLSAA